MASVKISETTNIEEAYQGGIFLFGDKTTTSIVNWCIKCVDKYLGNVFHSEDIFAIDKDLFVERATACKKFFTNSDQTKSILEKLIERRYNTYKQHNLYYDVPRVRIIPNSEYLSSGISYNYKPHRDTWYGASQQQINHWISVLNVSDKSTFFIAPQFFKIALENSSNTFDLDEWDQKYRPQASSNLNTGGEARPHPLLQSDIDDSAKIAMPLSSGSEVCFSGHHLHGSLKNKTNKIRISIDYRIHCDVDSLKPPSNIDNSATGNYKKYLIKHSLFG